MPTSVNFNGTTYSIPASGEVAWASLSNFLIAVAQYAQVTNKQIGTIRTATSTPVTVNATTDYCIVVNRTVAGATAVTLPTGVNGQIFVVVDGKGDAATNNITVAGSSQNIAGAASYVINGNYGAAAFQFSTTESQWQVVSERNKLVPLTSGGTGAVTAAAARTNLGLGTIATQAASGVAITGGSITGITDLAVADGGTGASTAGDARTNLGLGTIATQAASSVAITGGSITGITDLAVADGGTGASTANAALNNLLPTQTGNNGKLLSTDGTDASWVAALSSTLSSANIFVGNGSNVATAVAVSSEATLANTGAVTLKPTHTALGATPTTGLLRSRSGTYTPTVAADTNVTAVSAAANSMVWSQNGNVVTCSGTFSVTAAVANTQTIFTMDLPVTPTSNFASTTEAGGVGYAVVSSGTQANTINILANVGAKTVDFVYGGNNTGARNGSYSFQYLLN